MLHQSEKGTHDHRLKAKIKGDTSKPSQLKKGEHMKVNWRLKKKKIPFIRVHQCIFGGLCIHIKVNDESWNLFWWALNDDAHFAIYPNSKCSQKNWGSCNIENILFSFLIGKRNSFFRMWKKYKRCILFKGHLSLPG